MNTRHLIVFGLLLTILALTALTNASPSLAATTQPSNDHSSELSNHRAELTWLGTAGDARWSNPANWDGNRIPGPSDIARFPAGSSDAVATIASDSGTLPLQFTSSGHVLGFAQDGVYVAGGTHVLHVQFADAQPTTPFSTTSASQALRAAELAQVTYPNLWQGVTLTYDAPEGAILRSTYRIDPFADAAQIRLRYNAPVTVESDGRLAVEYAAGVIRETAPVAWQERAEGGTESVAVAFRLIGEREIGFNIGAYDLARPLFVDPSITWNTFIGESGTQEANIVALDGDGNLRVVGSSSKIGERYQVFLAKLDSNGNQTWYKVFGGSGDDSPSGMVVDVSGNAYIIGNSDLPWGIPKRGWSGGYADDFVAEFDTNGNLLWNTFLGGSDNDQSGDLVLDSTGLYATGYSAASWGPPIQPFPGDPGAMFLAKLDVNGNFLWNTFIGAGTWGSGITAGGSALYVTGLSSETWGSPIRPYSADEDAFVAKMDLSGNLVWNTFLGGSGFDGGVRIARDGSGNLYAIGDSAATWGDAPIRPFTVGERNDTYVAKLDGDGQLLWNTFLGGTKNDTSGGIALYESGNIYVVGSSHGTWGSPWHTFYGTNVNAYIAKLDSSGNLIWNGFVGGSTGDLGDGVAVNASGDIYLVGGSNTTWGSPINPHAQGADGMLVKISDPPLPSLTSISPNSATAGGPAFTLTVTGTNFVSGSIVQWNGSDRTTGFVSSTQLTATIPATDISAAGVAYVSVVNPAPVAGTSNAQPFYITQTGAEVTGTSTQTGSNPGASIGGTGGVSANATGTGTISVAIYAANPGGALSFGSTGAYVDVHIASGSSFTSVSIVDCHLNGGKQVYWWNGTAWALASNQSFNGGTSCVTVTVNSSTSPSLTDLIGTPLGAGIGLSKLFLPLIVR